MVAFSQFALLGNPNTGKTTLFNRLCGMRARTGNYPGVTYDARVGRLQIGSDTVEIVDLPGIYGLELDLPEAEFCRRALGGEIDRGPAPEAVLLIADATNLTRNLVLVGEVLSRGLPTVLALNMVDLARKRGLEVDVEGLSEELGCPVVAVNARGGEGTPGLIEALRDPRPPAIDIPRGEEALAEWADGLVGKYANWREDDRPSRTDRIDQWLLHPVVGSLVFLLIMTGLFTVVFSLAGYPMDWIEGIFGWLGGSLSSVLPEGDFSSLMVDGVVGGIAGTVVFLPQICLLFFLLSLLEDTGYLARAAFLVDGPMRRFGLPGQAFVPLLTSHACAIPGIMAARLIPDRRDRLASVLVAPFMSCSARLPVYVLLVAILFPDNALYAGLAFTGCYLLGGVAALVSAAIARGTILPGKSRPMVIELPSYKRPSLRTAVILAWDRGTLFLKKAGTVILAICLVLWWLSTYPKTEPPAEVTALREQAAVAGVESTEAEALLEQADRLESRAALRGSFAGGIGETVEPVLAPVGYDWQLSIAVVTSFAAREVFVSTLLVCLGLDEDADLEEGAVLSTVKQAERDDGSPLLGVRTAGSLLVFYVLAMQCLPTLAVTRRETGGWKWALLQLTYMSAVAYVAALLTYHGLGWMGVAG